jgi:hypothetical protein
MNFTKCNISRRKIHEKIEKYVLTNSDFGPILAAVRGFKPRGKNRHPENEMLREALI